MNKLPPNFPVGRLQLSKGLKDGFKSRAYGIPSRNIPMISPFGGLPPARRQGSTLQGDARSIQARQEGTLSQFMAAKNNPQDLRTQHPPTLSTGGVSNEVTSGQDVHRGTGLVRDAGEKSAHQLLRERVARLRV